MCSSVGGESPRLSIFTVVKYAKIQKLNVKNKMTASDKSNLSNACSHRRRLVYCLKQTNKQQKTTKQR